MPITLVCSSMTFVETGVLWLGNCYWQNAQQTVLESLVKSCPAEPVALARVLRIELVSQSIAPMALLSPPPRCPGRRQDSREGTRQSSRNLLFPTGFWPRFDNTSAVIPRLGTDSKEPVKSLRNRHLDPLVEGFTLVPPESRSRRVKKIRRSTEKYLPD